MIRRLAVIGVGLIGGSLALALKRAGLVEQVIGAGRGQANLALALANGVIDALAESPEAATEGADVVVLAVPVGGIPALMARIAPVMQDDVVLTDVGSTKQDVVAAARIWLGARVGQFVPAHPIAGAEVSGVAAAHADLFRGKDVILTPLPENPETTVARVRALWQGCGAQIETMTPAEHDRIFAAVSHLPHLAAFALMDELAGRENSAKFLRHAGSGFRDFTRIAGSHPELWRDIALANREAVVAELDAYLGRLAHIRDLIAAGNGEALMAILSRASQARQQWAQGKIKATR